MQHRMHRSGAFKAAAINQVSNAAVGIAILRGGRNLIQPRQPDERHLTQTDVFIGGAAMRRLDIELDPAHGVSRE